MKRADHFAEFGQLGRWAGHADAQPVAGMGRVGTATFTGQTVAVRRVGAADSAGTVDWDVGRHFESKKGGGRLEVGGTSK